MIRVCAKCGRRIRDGANICDGCGSRTIREMEEASVRAGSPATLIRVYRGAQQADAIAAFQRDSQDLAKQGYYPVSQSWAQGQWGCGAWLLALLLCIVLVGIVVFIYMVIVHPAGTFTVTYALPDVAPAQPPPLAASGWTPTHRVPDGGMAAWASPDPSLPVSVTLAGHLDVAVVERSGDWSRVVAVNGWTGWVDGRRLETRSWT
jgi:hypothetical protein